MTAQDIVIRPIITERSVSGFGLKKYTFQVAKNANKIEIAKAVEELFDVEVAKVNTINVEQFFYCFCNLNFVCAFRNQIERAHV